jgi:threonylcarbamoyladenosine tRNA methylthiotransferase CDKAL1
MDCGSIDGLAGKKVYIESYGCTYNHADTEKLTLILRSLGCTIPDSADDADAVVINTCTVVGATERRMLRRMQAFPGKELYVTGCMPIVQMDEIKRVCRPTVIRPEEISLRHGSPGVLMPGQVGVVQLAQGCVGTCSYCITRSARGPLKSARKDAILDAVRELARQGAVEIQLTGQDVAAWGLDTGESFPNLLRDIAAVPGRFHIRVGMMNPATVLGNLCDLVDAWDDPKLFRFLHLPVQSGSDAVLARMQRGYRVADFLQIVEAFRERHPDMMVSSDFIVGFPGETEADFNGSLDLVRQASLAKVNITRYSRRAGTAAAAYPDFPDRIKKDRSRALLASADAAYDRFNEGWIRRTTPVVVTEQRVSGSVVCRNPSYLNVIVPEELPIGTTGQAVILHNRRHYVIGRLLR